MKKIINGRTYNTETAKLMASWSNNLNRRDFGYCEEHLYRNNRGTWFLYGLGGAMTRWAKSDGNSAWGSSDILPMTEEEAREWAEKHLNTAEYEKIFGEQEEVSPSDLATRERVNVVLDTELIAKLREYSKETGIPVSRLLDKAIKETYGF